MSDQTPLQYADEFRAAGWDVEERDGAITCTKPAPVMPDEREPMSEEERALARRLVRCRLLPGSWDKRFIKDMAAKAEDPQARLTEKQREALQSVAHRYRKQLGGLG